MTEISQKGTEDAAFDYTSEWEGFSPDGRPDTEGIPTLGHGFALIITGGKTYSVRPNLVEMLKAIGIEMNPDRVKDLMGIVKEFNDGNVETAKALADKFRMSPINREQGKALFRHVVPEFIEKVKRGIGDTAYRKIGPERRAPLIDQAYRRPTAFGRVAKEVGEAIVRDDYDAAAKELLRMGRGRRSRDNASVLRRPNDPDRIRVRHGDVLGAIAQRESAKRGYRITVDGIVKRNGLRGPDNVAGGQFLIMPDPPSVDADEPENSSPPAPKRKPEPPSRQPPDPRPKPERAVSPEKHTEDDAGPAPESPERERLRAAMRQPVERVNHTLLKPASQITRAEIDEVMGHDGYWPRDGDARADAFQDKTRDFFETFFEQGAARIPPEAERPLAAKGGGDLGQARQRIADALAPAAERDGLAPTIKDLQGKLNELRFAGSDRVLPDLAVDGDFGPVTLARMDEELMRLGAGPLAESMRRGRRV